MEALSLHKQMAMGKGYPTSMAKGKDPSPNAPKPSGTAKTMPKMKVEKTAMPAKRKTSGG
jgi:hypothetical protein